MCWEHNDSYQVQQEPFLHFWNYSGQSGAAGEKKTKNNKDLEVGLNVYINTISVKQKERKNAHMVRVDVANHVIWTVEGVAQSVLEGNFMQTFNHTWKKEKENQSKMNVFFINTWLLYLF